MFRLSLAKQSYRPNIQIVFKQLCGAAQRSRLRIFDNGYYVIFNTVSSRLVNIKTSYLIVGDQDV